MQYKYWGKRTTIFLLLFVFFLCNLSNAKTVYAEVLRYYNYNTQSYSNYTGKQVLYTYNNKELSLTNPGILINGTALADYEELFVKELGLSASRTENTITLTDGKNVLMLTVGSKKATFNNEKQTVSVAPIKLCFDEKIQYYVPTRFVAEAFGYNYVWDSVNSTAKITKTLLLTINHKTVLYSNTFYSVTYKEQSIPFDMPVLFYKGCVLAPAKELVKALGCNYAMEESVISIIKEDISVRMELNSDSAFINNYPFAMDGESLAIINQKNNFSEEIYIPLEFVVTALGYELKYDDFQKKYDILDTGYTGKAELHPKLRPLYEGNKKIEEEQQPLQYYFDWETANNDLDNSEHKSISKVVAYALEDADVLEIYGITRDDIKDFMDSYALVFELNNVISNLDTKFFIDFSTPHLNYILMTNRNNSTKFLLMLPFDTQWQFVEKEDYIQVYFMKENLSLEDLIISSEVTPEPVIPVAPIVNYPEDKLVLCLPETINYDGIFIKDNYLENNFEIFIPGNLITFYEENPYRNPYECITSISIKYDDSLEYTVVTCNTDNICGYDYQLKDSYMSISVGKPSEIYNKIVVLDAGHGGKDPGAVRDSVYEKDINFSILYTHTKELFENSDIKVYYTRETDTFISLNDRTKFALEVGADLFISLHMNASVYESAKGTEVFYSKANNNSLASGLNSYKLAKCLGNNVSIAMNSKLRGITKSDYFVVHYNSVPAVLIELGFISNETERSKLTNITYQKKVAKAIYQSVIEIFSAYPTGR